MADAVFSEYEVRKLGFIPLNTDGTFKASATATVIECIGHLNEEIEVRTITKSCRGVVKKRITKETGNGTIDMSLHILYELYNDIMGRKSDALKDGVYGSSADTRHAYYCVTAQVEDEDGNIKYKAYPKCQVTDNVTRNVENGGEEVAESDLAFAFMPDANGFGMYEALASSLETADAAKWMESFTPDLVKKEG